MMIICSRVGILPGESLLLQANNLAGTRHSPQGKGHDEDVRVISPYSSPVRRTPCMAHGTMKHPRCVFLFVAL